MNKETKEERSPKGNPHVCQVVCATCDGSGKQQDDVGYFDEDGYLNHYIIDCTNPHCVDGYDAYQCKECSSGNWHTEAPIEDDWDQTFWYRDLLGRGCSFCVFWVISSNYDEKLKEAQESKSQD